MPSPITSQMVVEAARSCIGTKFVHQGRIKAVALDCAGLAVSVARDLGVEYQDVQGYGRDPYQNMLQEALDSQPSFDKFSRDQMQAGDLLLMRFGREPQHLAIYTGSTIIHSYERVGIVCEHDLDDTWRNRIIAVYRFKGIS